MSALQGGVGVRSKGSWSIKAVLPTVAPELDYSGLGEVRDGIGAQGAYLELIDPAPTALDICPRLISQR